MKIRVISSITSIVLCLCAVLAAASLWLIVDLNRGQMLANRHARAIARLDTIEELFHELRRRYEEDTRPLDGAEAALARATLAETVRRADLDVPVAGPALKRLFERLSMNFPEEGEAYRTWIDSVLFEIRGLNEIESAQQVHMSRVHAMRWRLLNVALLLSSLSAVAFGVLRKRAERQISESNTRYSSMIGHSPVGIFRASSAGTVVEANPAFASMLGYSAARELIGLSLLAGGHVEGTWWSSLISSASAANAELPPVRWHRRDGSEIWVRLAHCAACARGEIDVFIVDVSSQTLATQALQEALREHRDVLDTVPDVIFSLDADGNFMKWNRRFAEVSGFDPQGLANRSVLDVFAPESRAAVAQALLDGFDLGHAELECDLMTRAGGTVPMQWGFASLRNRFGIMTGITAAGRDVSERRQAQNALIARESLFRSLIENVSDMITIFDAEGVIRYNAPSVRRILGYEPEKTIGNSIFDFVHSDDRLALRQSIEGPAWSVDAPAPVEFRLRHRDGSWVEVESIARPITWTDGAIHLIATCRDVGDRRRAENDLRVSEEKYRRLFEQSTDVIYIGVDGRMTDMNPAGLRLFGYTLEELRGRQAATLYADSADRAFFLKDLQSRGTVDEYGVKLRRRDGSEFDALVTATHRGGGSEPEIIQGHIRDVTARKKEENARRQLTELLRVAAQEWAQTFDAVESLIVLVDRNGCIMRLNRAARDLASSSFQQLLRLRLSEIAGEPWCTAARLAQAVRESGQAISIEVEDPNSARAWDISATAAVVGTHDRVLILARDITRRRLAETMLARQAACERLLTEVSTRFVELGAADVDQAIASVLSTIGEFAGVEHCGMFAFSGDGRTAGVTHEWSVNGVPAMRDQLSSIPPLALQSMIDKLHRNETISIADREELQPGLSAERQILGSVGVRSALVVPILADNALIGFLAFAGAKAKEWTNDDVAVLRRVGEIFANAIGRHRAETALRLSEARFRSLSAAAPVGIIQTDAAGNTTYTNERWQMISEQSFEDSVALGWMHAVHPEDRPYVSARCRSGIAMECRILTPAGPVKWVSIRTREMIALESEITGVVVSVEDITERRNAEIEQARLQETVLRSEKMSAMGSLVAGIAHEVRNPLFSISATLDALIARIGEQADYARYVTRLREEVERLSMLMKELLDYGRPHPLALSIGNLADAIDESIRSVQPVASAACVTLERRLDTTAPVLCDRDRMVQVINNLVENAIHHSPSGGRVTIALNDGRHGHEEWIECEVRDDGPGFSPEDIIRVFEPFFTRRRGGTGLGLSIVKRIVEGHGGCVIAENRPNGGAAVRVSLPIATAAQAGVHGRV